MQAYHGVVYASRQLPVRECRREAYAMMREPYWRSPTRVGVCAIRCNPVTGRCHVFLGDEELGNYATPQDAVDALLGGQTRRPLSGADTRDIALPRDIADWQ